MRVQPKGLGQQRLLPMQLEDWLRVSFCRACGVVLLASVGAVWVSLLTWSVSDIDATPATGAANLLGVAGAAVATLLLKMFGLCTAVLMLVPMMVGLELTLADRRASASSSLLFAPLAIAALAGAASSAPILGPWPLPNGYGGAVGDTVMDYVSRAAMTMHDGYGAIGAALLLLAVGFYSALRSIGMTARQFVMLFADRHPMAGLVFEDAVRPEPTIQPTEPAFPSMVSALRPASSPQPGPPERHEPRLDGGAEPPWSASAISSADTHDDLDDDLFEPIDQVADQDSRMMAERFAPATAVHRAAAKADTAAERRAPEFAATMPLHQRPAVQMLTDGHDVPEALELGRQARHDQAERLLQVLADYGVHGDIRDIRPGPVVTLFELEPARGTKSSRVIGLADDIARSMSATSARIAVIPGRNAIGIELPNERRHPVLLRQILESETFRASKSALPLALGVSIGGEPVIADLARMPHLLVAGTTGSGKSVGLNAMVLSLLYRHAPQDCRLLLIDPKRLELSVYQDIPHLLTPVVTEPAKAVAALGWVVTEMEERYKRMAQLRVRNFEGFNDRVRAAHAQGQRLSRTVQTGFDRATGQPVHENVQITAEPMPMIVVVIDELADLMLVAGREIEEHLRRLAQMARAAGIHLIMATQRPSVDVITGTIKANFPTRISFKVASKIDSRTVLNEPGAEQLLGQGDMLYASGMGQPMRLHGPFVSDEEVETVAEFLRRQAQPNYVAGVTDVATDPSAAACDDRAVGDDLLFDRAVSIVRGDRKASASYLQRRLGIGYNRAANLIERMEREGIVTPQNGAGRRDVILAAQDYDADAA